MRIVRTGRYKHREPTRPEVWLEGHSYPDFAHIDVSEAYEWPEPAETPPVRDDQSVNDPSSKI